MKYTSKDIELIHRAKAAAWEELVELIHEAESEAARAEIQKIVRRKYHKAERKWE